MATSADTAATASAGPRRRRNDSTGRGAAALSSVTAGLIACALVVALAWRQGGYFPEHHLYAGAAAFAAIAALLVTRPPLYRVTTSALVATGALAALVVWTALSSHWSSVPDSALEDAHRTLVHLGLFGLGLLAAGSGRHSRHLLWAVLAVISIVTCAGLLSRLEPEWIDASESLSRFGGYRLAYPLGYWNALGAMAAMGVVLAGGLAGDPRSPAAGRAIAAGLVVPLGVAGYLSYSRGAWLAFFVGLAVLVLVAPHRTSLMATLALCATGLLVAVGRLGDYSAITEAPTAGAGLVAEGGAFGVFLLVVAMVVAAGQFVLSGRWMPAHTRADLVRLARPAGLAGLAIVLVAAAGVYALRSADVEGTSAAKLQTAENWVDRQWDLFMQPTRSFQSTGSERLTSAGGTRSDLYRVAFDGFQERPLLGDGGGGFEVRFAHDREVTEKVRDAHSLYLETLGELGAPGMLLLLTFLGAATWAAVAARRRGGALSGTQVAACSGALAVWVAHAGVDWDWQLPALTGVAMLLAACLFPEGRGRRRGRRGEIR